MFIVLLDSRVAQQFLLDLNVGASASQHRRVRMTKRVPTDFPNTSLLRCGPQVALQNVLLCPWSSNSIGKTPVVRIRVQTTLPQFLQWLASWGSIGSGLREASVLVSPALPFTTPLRIRTVRSAQLQSPHCRPMISLARRPSRLLKKCF